MSQGQHLTLGQHLRLCRHFAAKVQPKCNSTATRPTTCTTTLGTHPRQHGAPHSALSAPCVELDDHFWLIRLAVDAAILVHKVAAICVGDAALEAVACATDSATEKGVRSATRSE